MNTSTKTRNQRRKAPTARTVVPGMSTRQLPPMPKPPHLVCPTCGTLNRPSPRPCTGNCGTLLVPVAIYWKANAEPRPLTEAEQVTLNGGRLTGDEVAEAAAKLARTFGHTGKPARTEGKPNASQRRRQARSGNGFAK